ncbi:histidine kinase dimerization/phosphoacceptor domain -containing protein [Erythrobacter aureus]|uniref:histidine kinase dimerization/phosphoacceptor domain -containing protein n=1 Tax=Erythrobacter aureus TaxID=2182384 RepID=UPI003A93175D
MADVSEGVDLSICDREPIHLPGAIQEHGLLLGLDSGLKIRRFAGEIDAVFGGGDLIGRPLGDVMDIRSLELGAEEPLAKFIGTLTLSGESFDTFFHRSSEEFVLEFEHAPARRRTGEEVLHILGPLMKRIADAEDIQTASRAAAEGVRNITGYDRVMIYRFLADETGQVIAEARAQDLDPFLNHRYPASDIPRQARSLYLSNPVRIIPDVAYMSQPIIGGDGPLDLSGALLRSVSPIHIQYLKNMDVGASASFSLMRDGELWGLIACHNSTAKPIAHEEREMGSCVATALMQSVGRLEEDSNQREAVRLMRRREELLPVVAASDSVTAGLQRHRDEIRRLIDADGVALMLDTEIVYSGVTPPEAAIRAIRQWLSDEGLDQVATPSLSQIYAPAAEWTSAGSGLLARVVSWSPRLIILWFRREEVETVNWAGNPHKSLQPGQTPGMLTPRHSFELWAETVRGTSRPWRPAEQDAGTRFTASLAELGRQRTLRDLNRRLTSEVAEKDLLIREMHHRIQNSLQIVISMLRPQDGELSEDRVRERLGQARDRVLSVALVHGRLWRSEDLQNLNLETFFAELTEELVRTWPPEWQDQVSLDLDAVKISAHRALLIALVVSELLTNAVKYAYAGSAGPLQLSLRKSKGDYIAVTVSDRGSGKGPTDVHEGFGSRLVQRLVDSMGGELTVASNNPGTSVKMRIPLAGD